MVKAVLLIGVNQYGSDLDPDLAVVEEDEAIRRLLYHPVIRGFSTESMRRLKNPTRQTLAYAIEQLFRDRYRDQLLILVHSGQVTQDNIGQHHRSTCETTDQPGRTTNSAFIDSLEIAAGVVHDLIDQHLGKQQGDILDKSRSNPFDKVTAKEVETVDVRAQLEGEDWTIITSSPPSASHLHPNTDYPHTPTHVSSLGSRLAIMLGISATVIFTLALGSSYSLLQTTENQHAKQSLEKAEGMQANSDYAGCVESARLIPPNASVYLAAQTLLKICEVGQEISGLISQENYQDCLEQAKSIPALQPLLNTCRREQDKRAQLDKEQQLWDTAQQLALAHNFKDAVTHLSQISRRSRVASDAQTLINRWSNQLLEQAAQAYGEGQYDNAIALAQAIPASSQSYQSAQETIDRWRQVWESNTRQLAAAQHALEVGTWPQAIAAAEAIDTTSSYWRQQASNIIAQADERLLEEARKNEDTKRCHQYQTDYQQGVVDVMAEVGPKGGSIREKCAALGVLIADAY